MTGKDSTHRFVLTDRELSRAYVAEYFRRPGIRAIRILFGPGLIFLGASYGFGGAGGGFERAMGVVTVLFGVYMTLKPWIFARAMVRERRRRGAAGREIEVRVGADGIRIDDGAQQTELTWAQVVAAGRGPGYLWFETRGDRRATIPLRAVEDVADLEARFARHTEWRG